MAIYIGIEKISEDNGRYCYKVSPSSNICEPFFIMIIKGSDIIRFYKDPNCLNLLGCIDFADKQSLIKIDGLPAGIVGRVAFKTYQALKTGNFPYFLSIES